jgi:hypothetical protein
MIFLIFSKTYAPGKCLRRLGLMLAQARRISENSDVLFKTRPICRYIQQ